MVSVFEGQLARTWLYQLKDKTYTISLNHDTLSGVRMAMLNFEEINHSMGISSMIMDEVGHRIFFDIDGKSGYIEIKKSGWRAFSYQCFVNDESIPEQCTLPKDEPKEKFEVDISHVAFTPEEGRKTNVAWYVLNVKRLSDHVSTTVHRRFSEFAHLNSQVKQHMKGNKTLWRSLPSFPGKKLKLTTDHESPEFVNGRKNSLTQYLKALVRHAHAADLLCTRAFLGIFDQLREISFLFEDKLGLTLTKKVDSLSPAVVEAVKQAENCPGLFTGDSLSKINGESVSTMGFAAVIEHITQLPRPIVVHFLQVVACPSTESASHARAPVGSAVDDSGSNDIYSVYPESKDLAEVTSASTSAALRRGSARRPSKTPQAKEAATDFNFESVYGGESKDL